MKRILLFLSTSLFLLSCGNVKIHENVDEDLAKDAMQVVEAIIKNVEDGVQIEEVSVEDDALFESYYNKYLNGDSALPIQDFQGADKTIEIMASGSLVKYSKGISLESDKESLMENKRIMIESIESGLSIEEKVEQEK